MDQLVAAFVRIDGGKTFSFQPEYFSALCAGGYLDLCLAVDGGHFGLYPEDGVGERQIEFKSDVEPVAMQFGVLFLFDEDDEVARRSASLAGIAPAPDA